MVCTRRHVVYCFLSVTPSTKSMKFGSRYVIEGLSERDEIWKIVRGGHAVHQCQAW